MELSKTIATMAVVLAIVLAAGYAAGEENMPDAAPKQTMQSKVDARDAQRRAALEDQQRRKEHFERACSRPLKSDLDFELCRAAYKALVAFPK